ncbi:hypothetical protein PRIPAC_84953 [Pristionchus pacificus]|uniref:Uncharacterized protein n=1 Tax=Pristionchus pacificus TaxID=54126 RepID=A0A2A6CCT8_PRIPA|nr:hypothetical protein PRIPAC_84953 [Pristionchus pacificus]|eukprot:PDM75936.1 hypothetical protein PRIPAC_43779 [Pristionchus pacificus]
MDELFGLLGKTGDFALSIEHKLIALWPNFTRWTMEWFLSNVAKRRRSDKGHDKLRMNERFGRI